MKLMNNCHTTKISDLRHPRDFCIPHQHSRSSSRPPRLLYHSGHGCRCVWHYLKYANRIKYIDTDDMMVCNLRWSIEEGFLKFFLQILNIRFRTFLKSQRNLDYLLLLLICYHVFMKISVLLIKYSRNSRLKIRYINDAHIQYNFRVLGITSIITTRWNTSWKYSWLSKIFLPICSWSGHLLTIFLLTGVPGQVIPSEVSSKHLPTARGRVDDH